MAPCAKGVQPQNEALDVLGQQNQGFSRELDSSQTLQQSRFFLGASIVMGDGHLLPFKWSHGDDPQDVAEHVSAQHNLPADQISLIVCVILQLAKSSAS